MKRTAVLILVLVVGLPLLGDEKQAKEEVPPPKTLAEAHQQLENLLSKDELIKMDAMRSEDEMIRYHFGLGMGMRNNWGLWRGGPLVEHMNKLGFHHPDDMSGVILHTFWCRRHKKDFRLPERAAYYEVYWKAAAHPPKTAKDPKDRSDIDWNMSFGAGDENTPREIHVGKSKKTGQWLAYEYDKGIYEPDPTLLKRITDSQESK